MSPVRRELRRVVELPDVRVLGGLLVVVLLFFSVKWVAEGVWFWGDLITLFAPLENLYARIQRAGELPLWAPELAGGYPLLGNGQLGFFYLPHVLLRQFLPGIWVINASLLLHAVLAAWGMYLFLRWNRIGIFSAVVAGVLFAFGGTLIGRYETANVVFAFSWVPLLLALLQRFLARGRGRLLFLWAVFSVLHILVGHPPSVVLGLGVEVILLFVLLLGNWRRVRLLLPLAAASVLIVGITLPHTLPILDVLPETDRAGGLPEEELFDFSFPPPAYRGIIAAHPFGHGAAYTGPKNETELAAYLGPAALVLSVLGLLSRRARGSALWWFTVILLAVGILFSLGARSSVYRWLVEEGGQRYFAVPARFFFLAYLGLVCLAGVGMQVVFGHLFTTLGGARAPLAFLARPSEARSGRAASLARQHLRKLWRAPCPLLARTRSGHPWLRFSLGLVSRYILAVAVLAPVVSVAWAWYPGIPAAHVRSPELANILSNEQGTVRLLARERLSDVTPAANFGLAVWEPVLTGREYRQAFVSPFDTLRGVAIRFSAPRVLSAGTLSLRLLASDGETVRETAVPLGNVIDSEWTTFSFPLLSGVREQALQLVLTSTAQRAAAARLFFHSNPEGHQYDPTGALSVCQDGSCNDIRVKGVTADMDFMSLPSVSGGVLPQELLRPRIAAGYGIAGVQWVGAFPLARVQAYLHELGEDRDRLLTEDERQLLNRFPVTHLVGAYPPHRALTTLRNVTEIAVLERGSEFIRVYRNDEAFPRIHFARAVLSVLDPAGHLPALKRLQPHDRDTVVADREHDRVFSLQGEFRVIEDARARLALETETPEAAFLVVRDVLSAGWQATIDGRETRIFTVDGLFRGVVIPPGTHLVEFRYRPRWVRPALLGSGLAAGMFLLWGAWLVVSLVPRRRAF